MGGQQFGEVLSIFAIVPGATGHKGFTIFLQGDGIDGVEGDPIVGFQEWDEVASGLFQANADAGFWIFLAEVQ